MSIIIYDVFEIVVVILNQPTELFEMEINELCHRFPEIPNQSLKMFHFVVNANYSSRMEQSLTDNKHGNSAVLQEHSDKIGTIPASNSTNSTLTVPKEIRKFVMIVH